MSETGQIGLETYLRTGEVAGADKCDGGYRFHGMGSMPSPAMRKLGELYGMASIRSSDLEDHANVYAWLHEETKRLFAEHVKTQNWGRCMVGPTTVLRDPYSAKPYVLYYMTAPAYAYSVEREAQLDAEDVESLRAELTRLQQSNAALVEALRNLLAVEDAGGGPFTAQARVTARNAAHAALANA